MSTGAGSALRSRARLICCILAGALLVFALGATTAEAKTKKIKTHYLLALGDSISYGYSLVKFTQNETAECATKPESGTCEPPSAFEPGFPNYLVEKATKKGLKANKKEKVINISCPGETSDGLIGHNAALGGGSGAEYNPCGWHNTDHFRRHYEYGSVSQLEAAVGLLAGSNPESNPEAINMVTLQIGSNDELHVLGECRSEAYRSAHSFSSEGECVEKEAPALFGKIISNIGHTIGVMRAAPASYKGLIVVLGFYNPYGAIPADHALDGLQAKLNESIEEQIAHGTFGPGVNYANPFALINAGGVGGAAEQAAIEKYTEMDNPAAQAIELERITKEEELNHHPNLAEETAFVEAYGECAPAAALGKPGAGRFADEHCTTESSPKNTGEYERAKGNLAEFLHEEEIEGEPNLATVTKAQEENGKPNLAETTAYEEAAGSPNLAETEAYEEAHGSPDLAEATAFAEAYGSCGPKLSSPTGRFKDAVCTEEEPLKKGEYERVKPNLKEATEANESAGHAFYVSECEKAGHNVVECEYAWTTEGKAAYEAQVKQQFDEEVKRAFDAAVKAAFDAAVKTGFDTAVKVAFDEGYKNLFQHGVKFAFDKAVREGFEAAGSPGDIHPSALGYKELGALLKAHGA